MSRVQDILVRVRDTLGDSSGTRWTNDSLIRRLNEGQFDIAKEAELFRKTSLLTLIKGQYLYNAPDDFIKLKSVLFGQVPLEIRQVRDMERIYGDNWRLHSTTNNNLIALVTDRQDTNKLRLYPRPFVDSLYDEYTFTSTPYGADDAITDYTFDSVYGTVAAIYDTELLDEDISPFGIIVDGLEGEYLTIEYVRRPISITSILENPELPDAFDTALVRYICGTALRDDIDAQNRAMGNEELTLYQNELRDIRSVGKQAHTTTNHNSSSSYNGMG